MANRSAERTTGLGISPSGTFAAPLADVGLRIAPA
jgi:hypothetical protein